MHSSLGTQKSDRIALHGAFAATESSAGDAKTTHACRLSLDEHRAPNPMVLLAP